MSSQQQACQAVRAVLEAARPARGGAVGFTAYHAYRALEAIARNQPVGRPTLTRILGLGEAPVKTLLQRLCNQGLVEKTPRGHRLTREGWGTLRALGEAVVMGDPPETPLGPSKYLATSLLDPPRSLVDVYRVRDYLVMENCRKALIGGVEDGSVFFPGTPGEVVAHLTEWSPSIERGLLLIVPEECTARAYTGLLRLIEARLCKP